jgi:hypothetical protein
LPADAFADRVRARVRKLDDRQITAECLKPLRIGPEVFFERFGRNEETERIFNEAVPCKVRMGVAVYLEEHLTDEAFARAYNAFEDEHLFRVYSGYYEKEQKARDALRKISPDLPRKDWIRVGAALKHEFGEAGWPMWNLWSAPGKTYDPSTIRYQWESFREHETPATLGTILFLAKEASRG